MRNILLLSLPFAFAEENCVDGNCQDATAGSSMLQRRSIQGTATQLLEDVSVHDKARIKELRSAKDRRTRGDDVSVSAEHEAMTAEATKFVTDELKEAFGEDYKAGLLKHWYEDTDHEIPATFVGGDKMDSDGDGLLTKDEVTNNFQAYVDALVYAQIHPLEFESDESLLQGNASISMEEEDDEEDEEDEPDDPLVTQFLEMSDEDFDKLLAHMEMTGELSDNTDHDMGIHGNATKKFGKAKNGKQKKWLAKQAGKIEATICEPDEKFGNSWLIWPWDSCGSCRNLGFKCTCCPSDYRHYDSWCVQKCGDPSRLPSVPTNCELIVAAYCTETSSDCSSKALDIIVSWAAVAASLNPGTKAIAKAAKAAKKAKKLAGSLAAAKAFLKVGMRAVYKKMKKKAKKNLKKYIKKKGKELKEDILEDILDGGLEGLSAETIKNDVDVGELAEEIIGAIDPTGLYDAIKAFDGGKPCNEHKIDAFPEDGLDERLGCIPPPSDNWRCGPLYDGLRCGGGGAYCNEANGWCGHSAAHRDAQASTTYDNNPIGFANTNGRCGPHYGGRCNGGAVSWAVYCNTANGWCGSTAAHRDAQAGSEYDYEPQPC